jgi:peptidoglycan/xylan/chitin deacetylase (PgdA/CDA1 family)
VRQVSRWTAALLKCGASLVSVGSGRHTLLVLMYHRVLPATDPLLPEEPDLATFTAQMDILRAICNVLPLTEAVERLYRNSLPPRAACITFDDGYLNNLTYAVPALATRGLPATVFVAAEFLGGGCMWTDIVMESVRGARDSLDLSSIALGHWPLNEPVQRRRALIGINRALKYLDSEDRVRKALRVAELAGVEPPANVMLSEAQVKQLMRNGVDVGSHTLSHPILAKVAEGEAEREIFGSKAALEAITGAPVRSFAYPNGMPDRDYHRIHVELVRKAGFELAVSSAWGVCRPVSDRFQLPRMRPWESTTSGYAGRLLYTRRAPIENKV